MQSFVRNLLPIQLRALILLPGTNVVQKTRFTCDRRGHGVRAGGHAFNFDESHCGLANSSPRHSEQQMLAGQELEAEEEKVQAASNRDRRENCEVVNRDKKGNADGHRGFLDLSGMS